MIITLAGNVTHRAEHYAVVEAAGVGYQVFMSKNALAALKPGADVRFWTHEHLREDARELYGFQTQAEHRLFLKLVAISGIGPKMALNILALGSVKDIETTIDRADVDWLTRVPGIGKKTAQKIVLELKGKLAIGEGGDEEVVNALVNLGYGRDQARDALAAAPSEKSVEDRLRAALRVLGK
ncbi:MAG TPA: Holliday junction branch migration protein RuvA [Candidatus Binatia bacterium]|jgi:Holliday junction DNA helicase RuvA|nr:Holliday junction branch migration protein RuvA [Candidatus Binatia bacterium]